MNRVQHQKKLKNAIRFYKASFDLHPPYIVLCDPNFLFTSISTNVKIIDRLTEIFKGQVCLKVTECGLAELKEQLKNSKDKKFKTVAEETLKFIKDKCQLYKCRSHKQGSPFDCIMDNVEHKFNGIICTNDPSLRERIHQKNVKIPIFYLQNGLQIVPPSKKLKERIVNQIQEKYATVKKEKEEEEKPTVEDEQLEEKKEEVAEDANESEEKKN